MTEIDELSLHSYLIEPEKIGSVSFQGWRCFNCQTNLNLSGIHLRIYVNSNISDRKFSNCPNCQELTIKISSKITKKPTPKTEGKLLVTEKCHCCFYQKETLKSIRYFSNSSDLFAYYDAEVPILAEVRVVVMVQEEAGNLSRIEKTTL